MTPKEIIKNFKPNLSDHQIDKLLKSIDFSGMSESRIKLCVYSALIGDDNNV